MARGRWKAALELTEGERAELVRLSRRRKTAQGLATRARIILECADGVSNVVVAERLGTTRETVGKWRRRFVVNRIDGLLDEPRPGAPRTIDDSVIERLVTATLEQTPE
jgi:transposase